MSTPQFTPDWLNAEVCIENAEIAYADSIEDTDGYPVDTVISSGDLGVLIGLAKIAAPLYDALKGLTTYAEAVRHTAGMGKNQLARLEAAKAVLAKAVQQ